MGMDQRRTRPVSSADTSARRGANAGGIFSVRDELRRFVKEKEAARRATSAATVRVCERSALLSPRATRKLSKRAVADAVGGQASKAYGRSFCSIMELNRPSYLTRKSDRLELSRSRRRGRAWVRVGFSNGIYLLLLALVALSLCSRPEGAAAVTQAQVSTANGQIESAFASAYGAEKSGGNVSALDAKLNGAILLVQEAEAENGTDPAQAAADLQNATALAQSVVAESPSVSQQGSAARQTTEVTSVGAASAIVVVAALTYLFGGRIYRRAWLRLYKDYVVRPTNG